MEKLSREQLYKKFFKQEVSDMNEMFTYSFTPVIDVFKYKTTPLLALISKEEQFQSLALAMRSYIEKNEKQFNCHFSILDYLAYDIKDNQIEYLHTKLKRNHFSFNSNILDFIFLQKTWEQLNKDEQNIIKIFVKETELNNKYEGIENIDLEINQPSSQIISMEFLHYYPHGANKINENSMEYFGEIFKINEKDIKQLLDSKNDKVSIDIMLSTITSCFLHSCYNNWLQKEDDYLPIIEFFKNLSIHNVSDYPKTEKVLTYQTPLACFFNLYKNDFIDIKLENLAKLNYYTVDKGVQQFCQSDYGQYHPMITSIGLIENIFLKFPDRKKEVMEALFMQCDDNQLLKILTQYESSYNKDDIPLFFNPKEGDGSLEYISQFLFEEGKIETLMFLISKKPEGFQYIEQSSTHHSKTSDNDFIKIEQVYLNAVNVHQNQYTDKKQRQKI